MPRRSLAIAPKALLCVLLVTGCASYSPVLVNRAIDPALLLPCQDPQLAPDNPSDNELAAERLRLGKAYLDCKARHETLADRVKDDAPAAKPKSWWPW